MNDTTLVKFYPVNPYAPIEYANEAGGVITHISAYDNPTLRHQEFRGAESRQGVRGCGQVWIGRETK